MSIFSLLFGSKSQKETSMHDRNDDYLNESSPQEHLPEHIYDPTKYAIVDVEAGTDDNKLYDIGAIRYDDATFHKNSNKELKEFISSADFVCGHNIVHHDAKYLFGRNTAPSALSHPDGKAFLLVDTLYMSPLLFPSRPYHRLVKDDKLLSDHLNDPVNDCIKAKDLLFDEIAHWNLLSEKKKTIYSTLLSDKDEFAGFMHMVHACAMKTNKDTLKQLISEEYKDKICSHADINTLADRFPYAMAYALALIDSADHHSLTPGWVMHNFPDVEHIIKVLRHTRCKEGCSYCDKELNIFKNLKRFYGYNTFRTYDGEPLQENAVQAAANGQSLLAVFPTGGGKSLTFQLPALMDARSVHGLTVVLSPLQSLMKDQVDNLADRGITDAVTINGMLDPINRANAIERIQNGDASILYIAPEMLRSFTIEKILLSRHVTRFVIDEAHCFSAWGQDFRVDYLYIGKFIQKYQKEKGYTEPIPVSCFTATAKQKVIQDICDYFKAWLGVDMQIYASAAARTNLHYSVIHVDTDDDKYNRLRSLVAEAACPTIIYVSRVKRTRELAARLTRDGLQTLPYNGKMDAEEKVRNQEAFMSDKVNTIVATSAFGMGVDKSDVGLVVHYDISDSLENYVQEAGRAGRNPSLNARCFVLFCDNDLDKHFILLNQTKLSISEIQQVWKAIKDSTKQRTHICCSALEIARKAGWDDSVSDIETRVRTALSALEQGGYIERGNNVPHVYATGITVRNMDEARKRIMGSNLFMKEEVEKAVRIIKSLISQKYSKRSQDSEAESRVDYLADILGLSKQEIISAVERMRQDGILADSKDISAYLQDSGGTSKKSKQTLERFAALEQYILKNIPDESLQTSYKQLNDNAIKYGISSSCEKNIKTILYFLSIKGYAKKQEDSTHNIVVSRQTDIDSTLQRFQRRMDICQFIIEWLYRLAASTRKETALASLATAEGREQLATSGQSAEAVQFSVIKLFNDMKESSTSLFSNYSDLHLEEVEEALLYLSKINALKLEGGFLVLYNAMKIHRLKESRLRYKQDDYRMLNEFYKQKIQQIHIVGEYANLMVKDYDAALRYVQDYFHMDYQKFVNKYFKGERVSEIERNITPKQYNKIFGQLSERQMQIINDKRSRCIVVAAGPGSGKTRVLVHKLASLLLLEDVKHEQLLMLTFSRAAANEFKLRLLSLIGNAAHFVEIKTFHSYCFDLIGRIGNLEDSGNVVRQATSMIVSGEAEPNKIRKAVLVIDEAQDMDADNYALVKALMETNDDLRVIAVGDDDQNIYEFRGSSSIYMHTLSQLEGCRFIEMTDNYRSAQGIVNAANAFAKNIRQRMKTTPIMPVTKDKGSVCITVHRSKNMYIPVIEDVSHMTTGTTCILTQTNAEAATILALLHRKGIKAQLIQSTDGIHFCNLAEMRYFTKQLNAVRSSPVISDESWESAKHKTFAKYQDSACLEYIKRCIDTFETLNKTKYYSDFYEFTYESSTEDFCDTSESDVIVSTIHKSKGKEFDNVIMLITVPEHPSDDILRRYYVAMTRAKRNLCIHTDSNIFDSIPASHIVDNNEYGMPEEIVLQLSYKDVHLGYFKSHKQEVLSMRSGMALKCIGHYLYAMGTSYPIAKLSADMQKRLASWEDKGYVFTSANIRFIVAWKPKDAPKEEKETAVLLIDMHATAHSSAANAESIQA